MTEIAPETVAAVRRFNRFYTRRVGALGRSHMHGPYPLTEVRVLWELFHRQDQTAKLLVEELGLDPGYLSRILKRFEADAMLVRTPHPGDGRSARLELTDKGRAVFLALDQRTRGEVEASLARLAPEDRARLTGAMADIERLLQPDAAAAGEVILRTHRPGDLGWVTWRHGVVYAREHGWDARFEAVVARICADFADNFDPARERFWIAERDGEPLGSICLVKGPGESAQLRLLLLEPAARGLGLGRRLVEACIAFAREAGYPDIMLLTEQRLTVARAIYAKAGFVLESSGPYGFDEGAIAETWRLRLD
jgi:DNA-binding MarR family transcriptional regulator/predicted GNAT family N-acyltransferase